MTPEHTERIRRLFIDALRLPSSERRAFLIRSCGSDQELLAKVESLLSQSTSTNTSIFGLRFRRSRQPSVANPFDTSIAGRLLSPGTQLGPYKILSHLGSGGMGTVYQALDTRLDRIVAVKLMLPHLTGHAEFMRRFEREARAISSFSHPHICSLYDVGHQNGLSYLVMEYLDGKTLGHRLRRGRLEFDEVLSYAIQIASALNEAHNRKIVHRDIKPGNVMLTIRGAKLLDFGLATTLDTQEDHLAISKAQMRRSRPRLADGKLSLSRLSEFLREALFSSHVTNVPQRITAGGRIGTLPYMAPEQLLGGEIDWRTDMFGFGALLYEMATGRRAFDGSCEADVFDAVLRRQPPPVSSIQPLATAEFDHIVRTCLVKDPQERWQTPGELLRADARINAH